MKVPAKIVELGRAVEIVTVDGDTWEFPKNGKFVLATTPAGKGKLFIVPTTSAKRSKSLNKKGRKLRERFTGKDASASGKVIRVTEKKLTFLGRCKTVVYESDKYGRTKKEYYHPFKNPPRIYTDSKTSPRTLVISGSKIRVTERGILG